MTVSLSRAAIGAILAVAGASGCAEHQYVYTPDTANAQASGLPAARIEIPQERPQGSVELTSYGVTSLNADGRRVPALHVRMVVTNDGDATPWEVDTTQQLLAIPGEGQSRAMFANSDVHTLPNITIAQHERHVVDLYYPLPANMQSDRHLPRFDVMWQVETADRRVASRTTFDRVDLENNDYYAAAGPYAYGEAYWPLWAGWGPYWWYDPLWPTVGFVHRGPHFRGVPGHVAVGGFHGGAHAVGGFHGVGFHGGGAHVGRR